MKAALLAALLLAAGAARAAEEPVQDAFFLLRTSSEPAARAAACAELSTAPYRGPEAERALALVMTADLSDVVRLAAAKSRARYFDSEAAPALAAFFAKEPSDAARADMALTLSTEPAQRLSPEATRVLADLMTADAAPAVRRAAVAALLNRDDPRVLPWLNAAAKTDADASVRAAAEAAAKTVASRPPPPKPKKAAVKEPDPDGVKGKDPCPLPWAWCDCGGAIPTRSHCIRREECQRKYLDSYKPLGLTCSWSGVDLNAESNGSAAD